MVLQLSNDVKNMLSSIPWVFEKGSVQSKELLKYFSKNSKYKKIITSNNLSDLDVELKVDHLINISNKIAVKINNEQILLDQLFLATVKLIKPGKYYKIKNILNQSVKNVNNSSKDISVEEYMELNGFLKNLTKLSHKNVLKKVIPREDVEDKILTVLSRKYKNSLIIVGSKGSGKTSISLMLVDRLNRLNNIPQALQKSEVISINLGAIFSSFDTKDRFENLIKLLIKERLLLDTKTILFFDDIHILSSFGINGFTPPIRDELIETNIRLENKIENNKADEGLGSYLQNILSIDNNDLSHNNKISFIGTINNDFSSKFMDSPLREMWEVYNISEPNDNQMYQIVSSKSKELAGYYNIDISRNVIKYLITRMNEDEINTNSSIDTIINTLDSILSLYQLKTNKGLLSNSLIRNKLPLSFVKHYLNEELFITDKKSEISLSKLKNIDLLLKRTIIGQDEAIDSLCKTIKRSYFNIKDSKKPLASILFLGPTGVGKSQTAKTLSKILFGDAKLLRLDMSDFMERHTVSRLVGSPPGYVGYGEGGQLTDFVSKNPYSVILFDEIEKAHLDVLNILLSILEEGELTSGDNKTISFTNCIVILTSNLGAELISKANIGFSTKEFSLENMSIKEKLLDNLKKTIKPEIINRLNDVVVFNLLGKSKAKKILNNELKSLQKSLKTKYATKLVIEKPAIELLFKNGYSKDYGVRELHRSIERNLLDKVIDVLVYKNNPAPKKLKADVKNNTIILNINEK